MMKILMERRCSIMISRRRIATHISIGTGGFISGLLVAFLMLLGSTWYMTGSPPFSSQGDEGGVEGAQEEIDHPEEEIQELDAEEEQEEIEEPIKKEQQDVSPATGETVTIGGGAYAFNVPSGYRLADEMVLREGGVVTTATVTRGTRQQGEEYLALVKSIADTEDLSGAPPFLPGQSIIISLAQDAERDTDAQLAQGIEEFITGEGYAAVQYEKVADAVISDVTYVTIHDVFIAVRMYHASSDAGFDRDSYNALIATVREGSS
jgi:hypothetical protein